MQVVEVLERREGADTARAPAGPVRQLGRFFWLGGNTSEPCIGVLYRLFWLEIDGTGLGWLYSSDQGHLFSQTVWQHGGGKGGFEPQ